MEDKILIWEAVPFIRPFPANNYLFKISNWNTRARYENYLTMYVHCQLWTYLTFVVIADFERANVCWCHIENTSTFDDKIGYTMRYFVLFYV